MTDSNPGLDAARDLALQMIGRAVFNYQKIERMLKWLMAASNISVPLSKFTEEFEARKKRVELQSLGNVAKEAAAHLRNPPEHPTHAISEPWITSRIEGPDGSAVEWDFDRDLQDIVAHRNHLVHQRLGYMNPESEQQWRELSVELDATRERYLPLARHLEDLVRAIQDSHLSLPAEVQAELDHLAKGPET